MTTHRLDLAAYRQRLALDVPFSTPDGPRALDVEAAARALLERLSREEGGAVAPAPGVSARRALYARLTARPPGAFSAETLRSLDALLACESRSRPRVDPSSLARLGGDLSRCALWRGDITTLAVDAIVNACNDALLGCFRPGHACVDNAIHAVAGPRLREDCASLMAAQGHAEPVGRAKVTRAYHLPSRFVVHTVGPAIEPGEAVTDDDRAALGNAYRASLDLAAELEGVRSVAFPSISTGLFGVPVEVGARVAVEAVAAWLSAHPERLDLIVFDVFSERDARAYAAAIADHHGALR